MASSIGLGTYPGADDEATDRRYGDAIACALEMGCNVLDTAVAYRHQRSERVIGRVLRDLIARGSVLRDEVIISSKAGFLPFESEYQGDVWQYYKEAFLDPGLVTVEDLVPPGHCLAPAFIRQQIETSRRNLGCDTVDVYYLHNPETQLAAVEARALYASVRAAFEVCEEAVAAGHIGLYGVSTWRGFRVPAASPEHLSLSELMRCARDVAGDAHHFGVVMLPLSTAMTEGVTVVQAAAAMGLVTVAASSLHGGRLASETGLERDATSVTGSPAQGALQWVRSTSGVTTALVGMRDPRHVIENLALRRTPMTRELMTSPNAAAAFALVQRGDDEAGRSHYDEAARTYADAMAAADKGVAADPADIAARIAAASAWLGAGRLHALLWEHREASHSLEQSVASCDEALVLDPEYATAHFIRGRAFLSLGRLRGALWQPSNAQQCYGEAIQCYERALANLREEQTDAQSLRADMLMSLGRLHAGLRHDQQAREYYERAVQAADVAAALSARGNIAAGVAKAKALSGLGRLLGTQGDHAEAVRWFQAATDAFDAVLSEQPDCIDALTNKGNALQFRGDAEVPLGQHESAMTHYRAAVAVFEEVTRLACRHVIAHSNIGVTLAKLADLQVASSHQHDAFDSYTHAIEASDAALRVAVDSVSAHNSKGGSLAGLGRLQTAREQHHEAVESFEAAVRELSRSLDVAADPRIRAVHDGLRAALEPL